MSDTIPSLPDPPPATIAPDSAGGHLLRSDWFDELAPETQDIIRYAQQCLTENKRSYNELADALAQLKAWRQTHPELNNQHYAPGLVLDENLGSRLDPAAFVDFLLAQKSTLALKPYEFTALALLKEAAGLAELEAVARKDMLSPVAQHLTIKISRMRTATLLLRMMNDNPERRESVRAIMLSLLNDRRASV